MQMEMLIILIAFDPLHSLGLLPPGPDDPTLGPPQSECQYRSKSTQGHMQAVRQHPRRQRAQGQGMNDTDQNRTLSPRH